MNHKQIKHWVEFLDLVRCLQSLICPIISFIKHTSNTDTSHGVISKTYTNLQLFSSKYHDFSMFTQLYQTYPAPYTSLPLLHQSLPSFFHLSSLKAAYCFNLKYKQCCLTISDKPFISHVHTPKIMLQSFNFHTICK